MTYKKFNVDVAWDGGRNGHGFVNTPGLQETVSIPKEMNGPGLGTNPDEMFLSAAATCYLMTLVVMIDRSAVNIESISLHSEMKVKIENGKINCESIIHRPRIVLRRGSTEIEINHLRNLIIEAEANCMISSALRGNVRVDLSEEIDII